MEQLTMVVHGGAGPDSEFIRQHLSEYELGLSEAVDAGYAVLEKGGSAEDAVEAAIRSLEDNVYFNAGRGAALNADGKVQTCVSMMKGSNLMAGAAAIVTNVKNPISFARELLNDTTIVYIGGPDALESARDLNMDIEPDAYFVTDHQVDAYLKERANHPEKERSRIFRRYYKRSHGTVGAVAVDKNGNIAAGTSTGGTEFCQPGRIGDSSMIGVGSYADNRTAAISSTGDGEYLIREVIAHSVSAAIEHTGCTVQEACNYVINVKNGDSKGDMGVIGVDARGNIGIAFNSERMHRAWKKQDGEKVVKIYK